MLPYGEWIIFSLAFGFWAEKIPGKRMLISLAGAWMGGRVLELLFAPYYPWNWHYARLAVILVCWLWAWHQAKRRVLPLVLVMLALISQDLFLVNEPGIFLADKWLFAGVIVLAAFISAHEYWEVAAAISGGLLINQLLSVFFLDGIVKFADLPDDFTWNFWVAFLAMGGLVRGWRERMAGVRPSQPDVAEEGEEVRDIEEA